jgi:hypothetical protein
MFSLRRLSLQLICVEKVWQGDNGNPIFDQSFALLGRGCSTDRTLFGLTFVNAAGFFGKTRTNVFSIAD